MIEGMTQDSTGRTGSTEQTAIHPQLFHSLTYADAVGAQRFLEALGFVRQGVYTDPEDPNIVMHAEYRWRDNGGVMFGSVRPGNPHASAEFVGNAKCYVVVETEAEVDAVYARGIEAGGRSVAEPEDQDYGGRGASLADPEGNEWSFGSYGGAQ